MRFGVMRINGKPSFLGNGLFLPGTAAAPSISFLNDPDTGFYSDNANGISVALGGLRYFRFSTTDFLGGTVDNYLRLAANGSVGLVAAGTNQSITLTPSGSGEVVLPCNPPGFGSYTRTRGLSAPAGTDLQIAAPAGQIISFGAYQSAEIARFVVNSGHLLLGGLTTDGSGVLQFPAGAADRTSGFGFAADTFLFRSGSGAFTFEKSTGPHALVLDFSGSTNTITSVYDALAFKTNGITALTLDTAQRTKHAGELWLSNAYAAGAPAATGYVVIYDSAGNPMKLLCSNV